MKTAGNTLPMADSLQAIFDAHNQKVSDKWDSYLRTYERVLSEYRDRKFRMLEIGIQNGGSLEIWAKYFASAEAIIGCDIDPKVGDLRFDDARISVMVGDGSSVEFAESIRKHQAPLDLIIDDGSHHSAHIIASFVNLFDCLADGGTYVIEDLQCSYYPEYGGGLFVDRSAVNFFKVLADIINREHWDVPVEASTALGEILADSPVDALPSACIENIHSIEFLNSMVIVRKAPADENAIGKRVITGTQEAVCEGHKMLSGTAYDRANFTKGESLRKRGNAAELRQVREQVAMLSAEAHELRAELSSNRTELAAIQNSLQSTQQQLDAQTEQAKAALEKAQKDKNVVSAALEQAQIEIKALKRSLSQAKASVTRSKKAKDAALASVAALKATSSRDSSEKQAQAAALAVERERAARLQQELSYANFRERQLRFEARTSKEGGAAPVFCLPANDLEYLGVERDLEVWKMTGFDPHFELRIGGPLAAGHYLLSIEGEGDEVPFEKPKLYYDAGEGFSEVHTINLRFQFDGKDSWTAKIALPVVVHALRFDPSNKPGELRMGDMRLQRLSRLEFYSGLAKELSTNRRFTPKEVLRLSRRATKSLAAGGLSGLARDMRNAAEATNKREVEDQLWVQKYDTSMRHLLSDDHEISNVNMRQERDHFVALTNDPYFEIKPSTPVRSGLYTIRAKIVGDDVRTPKLYIDTGNGFGENECVYLRSRDGDDHFEGHFNLPSVAIMLRFDPSETEGAFKVDELTLERLSGSKRLAFLARRAAKVAARDPKAFWQKRNRYLQFLKNPHFLDVGRAEATATGGSNYHSWIKKYDYNHTRDKAALAKKIEALPRKPLISVVMPVYNTPLVLLDECIQSVVDQVYDNWEFCIADDRSPNKNVRDALRRWEAKDPRIKVVYRKENGHISAASNSAAKLATGEWIALLDHDDKLSLNALAEVAIAINENPDAKLIYSDEDKITEKGERYDPYFKCDWNRDLFLSHNLITHLGVYEHKAFKQIGGFRSKYDGAQDYDLALQFVGSVSEKQIIHIPKVLYHWRAVEGSTALSSDQKNYAMTAGERALQDYLDSQKISATAKLIGLGYKVEYQLPKKQPLVSIIIPTYNGFDLLKTCIDSITKLTTYKNFEIVVADNGSDDRRTIEYLKELGTKSRRNIVACPGEFNYSAINNHAVKYAKGELILLLNNDTEVISPDWLTEMVSVCLQPGVGAVGAKLLYPDNSLQHGGVIMGLGGLAAHAHSHFDRHHPGYVGRGVLRQTMSAVTAACLLVKKSDYNRVGGLNETDLKIAYNDVDFCLRLKEHGLRNVWTPFAELYHYESVSRGYEDDPEKRARFEKEKAYMQKRHQRIIDYDPAYSPNLTLEKADFSLAFPPRIPGSDSF